MQTIKNINKICIKVRNYEYYAKLFNYIKYYPVNKRP